MSDTPENENLTDLNTGETPQPEYKDEYSEFETVFSDPAEHHAKKPSGGKKRVRAIIAAALAVAVLTGGTVTVIKLIPKKETDDQSSSDAEEISLLELKADNVNRVSVTNSNGSFTLRAEHKTAESSDSDSSSASSSSASVTTTWSADGVDSSLTSSSKISSAVSSLFTLSAMQQISGRSEEECGLNSPSYKAEIETSDGSFTVTAGEKSYDGLGYYTSVSGKDGIYLVDVSLFTGLDFTLLDFADTSAISGVDTSALDSNYVTESSGSKTLSSFDSITFTGKNFPQPLVIVPNNDEKLSQYLPYATTSPEVRLADKLDDVIAMFNSGLSASGAYSYDVSAASLKKFGLDSPYLTVTLKAGAVSRTFKISAVRDDGGYAVIADDSRIIKKVDASSISFIDNSAASFYGKSIYMSSINDLSNMTFTGDGFSYSFDIVYDDSDDADEEYVITLDGKKLTASYFQNLYQQFVSLNASDFETSQSGEQAVLTITLTYSSDGSKKTLAFYPSSATKYVYKNDGKAMGRISSGEISRFIKQIARVAEGKDVS